MVEKAVFDERAQMVRIPLIGLSDGLSGTLNISITSLDATHIPTVRELVKRWNVGTLKELLNDRT